MEASDGWAKEASLFTPARRYLWWPATIVAILIAVCAGAVFFLGGGHYTFPVDDPYIHLALAKHIAKGHYGINPGEFAAPSSSILWPFLLAPVAGSSFAVAAIVLFNAGCALATVSLFAVAVDRLLVARNASRRRAWVVGVTLAFSIATNQVGLALLGMEHSLQVLIAVWLATLVLRDRQGFRRPSAVAIAIAIALGPLVRYEMVGLSVLVAAYFAWRRRAAPAALGLAIAFAGMVAFSLLLVAHGQGALPTSVLAKSGTAPGQPLWVTALANLRAQFHSGWAVMLWFAAAGALIYRERRRWVGADRALAALILAALLGHLLVGRSGWFGRYEAYVLAFSYLLAAALFADTLSAWIDRPPSARTRFALAAFGVLLSARYAAIIATTPLAGLNIYQQQAQVARFVSDYYRAPVGVNDIGYVAWKSDHYVLDFVGLASRDAFLAQRQYPHDSGAWVGPLTQAHDVHFAAIYDAWFSHLPSSWQRCGWLHLGSKRITAADDVVAFYALDGSTRRSLPDELRAWAATLPPGVRFDFAEGCR